LEDFVEPDEWEGFGSGESGHNISKAVMESRAAQELIEINGGDGMIMSSNYLLQH